MGVSKKEKFMLRVSADRLDIMEETVKGLAYRLGDNYDTWFPSIEDIAKMRPLKAEDLPFLLWVMYPRKALSDEQKAVKNYIRSILAEEVEFDTSAHDITSDQEAAAILQKFGYAVTSETDHAQ